MQPAKLQQLLQAAAAHLQAGRSAAAAAFCAEARAAAPREFAVLHLSGLVALKSGRAGEAADFLGAARRLSRVVAGCGSRSTTRSLSVR